MEGTGTCPKALVLLQSGFSYRRSHPPPPTPTSPPSPIHAPVWLRLCSGLDDIVTKPSCRPLSPLPPVKPSAVLEELCRTCPSVTSYLVIATCINFLLFLNLIAFYFCQFQAIWAHNHISVRECLASQLNGQSIWGRAQFLWFVLSPCHFPAQWGAD